MTMMASRRARRTRAPSCGLDVERCIRRGQHEHQDHDEVAAVAARQYLARRDASEHDQEGGIDRRGRRSPSTPRRTAIRPAAQAHQQRPASPRGSRPVIGDPGEQEAGDDGGTVAERSSRARASQWRRSRRHRDLTVKNAGHMASPQSPNSRTEEERPEAAIEESWAARRWVTVRIIAGRDRRGGPLGGADISGFGQLISRAARLQIRETVPDLPAARRSGQAPTDREPPRSCRKPRRQLRSCRTCTTRADRSPPTALFRRLASPHRSVFIDSPRFRPAIIGDAVDCPGGEVLEVDVALAPVIPRPALLDQPGEAQAVCREALGRSPEEVLEIRSVGVDDRGYRMVTVSDLHVHVLAGEPRQTAALPPLPPVQPAKRSPERQRRHRRRPWEAGDASRGDRCDAQPAGHPRR